jgi:GxxExxY protein
MPIIVGATTRRMEEAEFRTISYQAMRAIFDIHNDFGRFFDEKIYKREFARRVPSVIAEVPIEVLFEDFQKTYFLDSLVEFGAVFEFKAVETLNDRHRSQLLSYLFLTDLPRGKLINMRPERVQHEFVNATLRLPDRLIFDVVDAQWRELEGMRIKEWFTSFLRDIGTNLDISLYEASLTHFLGGEEKVLQNIDIMADRRIVGTQAFRMVTPDVAFKITAMEDWSGFEVHARRLLEHTGLGGLHWINVTRTEVLFRTIWSK